MRRRPLLSFFALANLLSWIAWAPLVAQGLGWTTATFSPYLHLVGGLGPMIAAFIVTAVCAGRTGLARLVERGITVRSRLSFIVFAVLAPVLLFVISAGWLFSILTGSILMTWLFNTSHGSILAVALFHGALDIVMTSPVEGALPFIMGAIITIWGIAIPFVFGASNLSPAPRVQDPTE